MSSASIDSALSLGAAMFRESDVEMIVRIVDHPYGLSDDKNFKYHITGDKPGCAPYSSLAEEIVYEHLVQDDSVLLIEDARAAVTETLKRRLIRMDKHGYFSITWSGRRMLKRGYRQRRSFAHGIFRQFS